MFAAGTPLPQAPVRDESPVGAASCRERICSLVFALLAFMACSATAAPPHFVVLLYHHVADGTPPVTSVSPSDFGAELDYLADNCFHVRALSELVDALDSGEDIPDRSIAITFDDAYSDILTNAAPRLQKRGWPFTVFVATDAVDQQHAGIMSWDDLRNLKTMGAELANHSRSHAHLIRRLPGEHRDAWLTRVRADIADGAKRLKDETGTGNELFAWPYGEYDQALDNLAGDMGLTAFTQASGAVGDQYDRQRLPRFPVAGNYTDLDELKNRFDALPLPVTNAEPADPERSKNERRPELTLTIAEGNYQSGALACYVSGQGRVAPTITGNGPVTLTVRAPKDLPGGRSRYNCTAPSRDGSRWYWFSRPWFIPNPDGSWPEEP